MLTKRKSSMVMILPPNSLVKEKEDLLLEFSNLLEKPLAVFNKSFSDLEVVKEEKIAKEDRLSICNGVVCDSEELLGIKVKTSNMPIVKEIDLSPLDEEGDSTNSKLHTGNFKIIDYCGYGEPVFDRKGNILAEISPDKNIFFLLDVLSDNIHIDILEYILDEAGLYLFDKSLTGRTDSYSNASFLYKNIASKKIDEKIKVIKDTVEKAGDKIALMEEKLVTMIRLKDKAQIMMDSEYKLRNTIAQKVKSDLDDISKIDGYTHIRFINDKVIGITDEIIIEHKDKKYMLGKYRIEIGFDNSAVRIFNVGKNLNTKSPETQHPHVSNNNACLGNIQGTLHQYVSKYEFSTVFDLLYQLLSSYNSKSPYCDITYWPEV